MVVIVERAAARPPSQAHRFNGVDMTMADRDDPPIRFVTAVDQMILARQIFDASTVSNSFTH